MQDLNLLGYTKLHVCQRFSAKHAFTPASHSECGRDGRKENELMMVGVNLRSCSSFSSLWI